MEQSNQQLAFILLMRINTRYTTMPNIHTASDDKYIRARFQGIEAICLADTRHIAHLFIAEPLRKLQGNRPVNFIKLIYFLVQPGQLPYLDDDFLEKTHVIHDCIIYLRLTADR